MTQACGCPDSGVVTDEAKHDAYHELAAAQQAENDPRRIPRWTTLPSETILDERARKSGKRASGKMRRAAHD